MTFEEIIARIRAGDTETTTAGARMAASEARLTVTPLIIKACEDELAAESDPSRRSEIVRKLKNTRADESLMRRTLIAAAAELKNARNAPAGPDGDASAWQIELLTKDNTALRSANEDLAREQKASSEAHDTIVRQLKERVSALESGSEIVALREELAAHKRKAEIATRNVSLMEGFMGVKGVPFGETIPPATGAVGDSNANSSPNTITTKNGAHITRFVENGKLLPDGRDNS